MKKSPWFLCYLLMFLLVINTCAVYAYEPRFDEPGRDNKYYTTLNPFHQCGFGMTYNNIGNCTCYAYGRAYENLKSGPNLSTADAYKWYAYNANGGYYPYSSDITKPALGAICVWKKRGTSWGHVAVVEDIDVDTITTSESGWKQYYFKTLQRNMTDPELGQTGYDFVGYIYVCGPPKFTSAPQPVPNLCSQSREYPVGTPIEFKWNVSYGTDAYWVYVWKNGTEIYGTKLDKNTSFTYTPDSSGNYMIAVNAVNNIGFSGAYYDFRVGEPGEIWQNQYIDVDGNDWYYDSVATMSRNGFMNGISINEFAPYLNISRAMLVTILFAIEKWPMAQPSSFTDISPDAYYRYAVDWANRTGIINGINAYTFAPDQSVTREQFASILCRYLNYKGITAEGDIGILNQYSDGWNVSEYARTSVSFVASNGIISGNELGLLNPKSPATRAECAKIMAKTLQLIN